MPRSDLKGDELRAKEESIISFYLQAIKLGQRRAAVVRRTVQLLFKNGQGDVRLELLSNIPMESQLAGEERQAARFAVENRDFPARTTDRPEGSSSQSRRLQRANLAGSDSTRERTASRGSERTTRCG